MRIGKKNQFMSVIAGWACSGLLLVLAGCAVQPEPIGDSDSRGNYSSLVSRVGQLLVGPNKQPIEDRYYLIRDLGGTGDPRAYTYLAAILRDPGFNSHEKGYAAEGMAYTGDPQALDALQQAIESGAISEVQGVIAFGILARRGNNAQALERVIRALDPERELNVRLYAVNALRWNNPDHRVSSAAIERSFRSDPSMRVRVRAACALEARGDKDYRGFIEKASQSTDTQLRLEVAEWVEFSAWSIPLLLQLLGDEDGEVGNAAWDKLEKNLVGYIDGDSDDLEGQLEIYRQAAEHWIKNNQ